MIGERLTRKVNDATVWYARDLKDPGKWLSVLGQAHQQELLQALDAAKYAGCTPHGISERDFPLPTLRPQLQRISKALDTGIGFFVMRGMPLAGLALEDIELLYAGMTSHLGFMVNQDTQGTLIDRVYDQKKSYDDISVRGYTTNAQLTPHCDTGDLVCLLCIRPAMLGGMNNISCSMAVYNEILESFPDYLEPLYRGFHYNIRGNGPVGPYQDITAHRVPVFSYHKGMLSCRYNQKAILTAQELPHAEPLSDLEVRAVNKVAELAMRDDIRFDMHMEAGDVAFFNNNTVLHNRDRFIDHEDESRRRLLLRQWINLHEARELTDEFADHYNTGPRRGPAIHHRSPAGDQWVEVHRSPVVVTDSVPRADRSPSP